MKALLQLQQATLNARDRCNDKCIGTEVSAGLFRIVRVTYKPNGCGVVTPVSGFMPLAQTVDALNDMQPQAVA